MAQVLKFRSASGEVQQADVEAFARTEYPALLQSAFSIDFEERMWARIQQSDKLYGDEMPWSKTHERIRFRPSEVTAWIGPNRDGKSLLLGYLAAHWALQQNPVVMCSLEMDVGTQLKRISRQLLCTDAPHREAASMLLARLCFLRILDYVGHLPPARVIALAKFAAVSFECKHLIIDNLTLIVPPGRNTDESSAVFVRQLVEVARATNCHIHLVGHVRKPEFDRPPSRYDWRGTGACPDMVQNVIIVYANEKKRRAEEKNDPKYASEPDVYLNVDKQRNGEYQGRMGFWWRPAALQLVQHLGDDAAVFDPFDCGFPGE